jgi:hypothetical protein
MILTDREGLKEHENLFPVPLLNKSDARLRRLQAWCRLEEGQTLHEVRQSVPRARTLVL